MCGANLPGAVLNPSLSYESNGVFHSVTFIGFLRYREMAYSEPEKCGKHFPKTGGTADPNVVRPDKDRRCLVRAFYFA